MATDLIFVGGFLGAGKTTLLTTAARTLARRGRRVGVITNDQAPHLFDSAVLRRGSPVAEVSGACFCCSFDDLIAAVEQLESQGVDCILAEPVGSCTDLSATLLQPLKDRFRPRLRTAPLTVLADPDRLLDALDSRASGLHEATAYIYWLQLLEADRILVTKADTLDPGIGEAIVALTRQAFPGVAVGAIAGETGAGVDSWLDDVLAGGPAGTRLLEMDYDRYALGEAALGWCNATVSVQPAHASLPARLVGVLRDAARANGLVIGHAKVLLAADGLEASAQCTDARAPVRSSRTGVDSAPSGRLVINARVQAPPDALEATVRAALELALERASARGEIIDFSCFSPSYPRPTHRYDHVV
ncbi:MAG: hypothetical protein ACI8PZ_000542 [Myxococcota bacterium]